MSVRTLRALTVTAAAVALLSACGQGEVRDESGAIETGGDTNIFTIKGGDCFNDVSGSEISEVPTVPCAEPHDNEVYGEYNFTGDDYPGDDVVAVQAKEQCVTQWEAFVGLPYEDSDLEVFPITPTEGSWGTGDRLVSCAIWDPAGLVTGTLAQAAR